MSGDGIKHILSLLKSHRKENPFTFTFTSKGRFFSLIINRKEAIASLPF